jgi:hypothetical protein
MTRTVRNLTVAPILRAAQTYLFQRDIEAAAKRAKEAAVAVPGDKKANAIKDHVAKVGKPAGDHVEWYFDEPMVIGAVTYLGFRNEAKSSTFIDTDKADELIEKLGLKDKVEKTTVYVDYNELYNLNQLGLVSDDDIDSVLVTDVNYALTVIK